MNGIYDFEQYRTPYLDVEMLMEYKAKKRAKKMLILVGMASVLMIALSVVILYKIATIDSGMFVAAYIIFAVYMGIGTVIIGKVIKKKGDTLCLA